ncbi:MAG: hypothetical protein WD845_11500 [Pirellulales bacterium]
MLKLAPRVVAVVLACSGFLFAASALAADPVDVSGEWAAMVDIAGNAGMPTFTLKQDGDKLTGKYKGQFGEADLKGTVKGDEIEFSFEIQAGAEAVYKGKLADGKLKGTCDYAGQADGTWTAEKKK